MPRVTVDESVARQLQEAAAPVEIYSQTGQYLGRFDPLPTFEDVAEEFHLSPQQLEQALNQSGGRPLAEIWKDLGRT